MPTNTAPTQNPAAKNPSSTSSANSTRQIQPYLFFDGICEQAIEFYRRAVGAEVTMLMRFKDAPPADQPGSCPPPPTAGEKIMHASIRIGSTEVLASDGECKGKPTFQGFSLSLTVANEAEATRFFSALAEGGQVQMPLMKTFFSPSFGMVTDRFGVCWMIYVKA